MLNKSGRSQKFLSAFDAINENIGYLKVYKKNTPKRVERLQ